MQKDVDKDTLWVVGYLDLVVYHDHDFHVNQVIHGVFHNLVVVYSNPSKNPGKFLDPVICNLDGIKLGNNS